VAADPGGRTDVEAGRDAERARLLFQRAAAAAPAWERLAPRVGGGVAHLGQVGRGGRAACWAARGEKARRARLGPVWRGQGWAARGEGEGGLGEAGWAFQAELGQHRGRGRSEGGRRAGPTKLQAGLFSISSPPFLFLFLIFISSSKVKGARVHPHGIIEGQMS
jgi:hypothetical protein